MFGHRPDGRRIKSLDPFFYVVPHIMPKRSDSQVYAEMKIDVTPMDEYLKKCKDEHPNMSHMTIITAAMARVSAEIPAFNRFIMGKRVYARNHLSTCIAIVKEFVGDEPDETVVKIEHENGDTVFDTANKIEDAVNGVRNDTEKSGTDKILKVFFKLPTFIISALISTIWWFDRRDIILKPIVNFSPFHTTMFVTNMASIGMNSIYHHIYDNGNTTLFLSMSKREYNPVYDKNGIRKMEKVMHYKFVCDERICSGYTYSRGLKLFEKYVTHPELLEQPMEIKPDKK